MKLSDGAIVPGNLGADAGEVERRTRLFWRPYREAAAQLADAAHEVSGGEADRGADAYAADLQRITVALEEQRAAAAAEAEHEAAPHHAKFDAPGGGRGRRRAQAAHHGGRKRQGKRCLQQMPPGPAGWPIHGGFHRTRL
jgi:hypothetical protein